jgi:hypothetical protein
MSAGTLTIRLDPATARALEEEAKRTNSSRGEVLRRALAEHLETKKSTSHPFAAVLGCMSGPPDLSTNEKYKKGLGATSKPSAAKAPQSRSKRR